DPRRQDPPDLLRDAGRCPARHAHAGPAPRRAGAHQPDHVRTRPGEVPPRRGLQPPARPDLREATMATTFEYAVRDRNGKLVKGTLDADNQSQVVQKLRTMGFAPVSISEANAGMKKEITIPGLGKRVKLKDLAIMARQFATMISSGLSLLRALTILAEQTENKELSRVLGLARADVEAGQALSSALAKFPRVFPPLMINMVRAGEVGG